MNSRPIRASDTKQLLQRTNISGRFWGHDAMKGSRKNFKILIVSEMVRQFHLDSYIIFKTIKNTFFQNIPGEIAGPSQKLFFKAIIFILIMR